MKKEFRVAFKTLAIKARVYNFIRTALFNKRITDFTEKEKIEFFDRVFSLNKDAHTELNNYKHKRQYKASILALREKRKELQTNE